MVTSIDQEGTGKGYDRALLQEMAMKLDVPIIASGGAGSAEDVIKTAMMDGIDACSFARIIHYNESTLSEIRQACIASSINVRQL